MSDKLHISPDCPDKTSCQWILNHDTVIAWVSIVLVMAWCQLVSKPSAVPILSNFQDLWHHMESFCLWVNSLMPICTMKWHGSWSTLFQEAACFPMVLSHFLNNRWSIVEKPLRNTFQIQWINLWIKIVRKEKKINQRNAFESGASEFMIILSSTRPWVNP